jgi:hypothetical protein
MAGRQDKSVAQKKHGDASGRTRQRTGRRVMSVARELQAKARSSSRAELIACTKNPLLRSPTIAA